MSNWSPELRLVALFLTLAVVFFILYLLISFFKLLAALACAAAGVCFVIWIVKTLISKFQ